MIQTKNVSPFQRSAHLPKINNNFSFGSGKERKPPTCVLFSVSLPRERENNKGAADGESVTKSSHIIPHFAQTHWNERNPALCSFPAITANEPPGGEKIGLKRLISRLFWKASELQQVFNPSPPPDKKARNWAFNLITQTWPQRKIINSVSQSFWGISERDAGKKMHSISREWQGLEMSSGILRKREKNVRCWMSGLILNEFQPFLRQCLLSHTRALLSSSAPAANFALIKV